MTKAKEENEAEADAFRGGVKRGARKAGPDLSHVIAQAKDERLPEAVLDALNGLKTLSPLKVVQKEGEEDETEVVPLNNEEINDALAAMETMDMAAIGSEDVDRALSMLP